MHEDGEMCWFWSTSVSLYTWTLQWRWSFQRWLDCNWRMFSQWITIVRGDMIDWLICCSCPFRLRSYIRGTGTGSHQSANGCHESFNLWLHYFVESALPNHIVSFRRGQTRHFGHNLQWHFEILLLLLLWCDLQSYCKIQAELWPVMQSSLNTSH